MAKANVVQTMSSIDVAEANKKLKHVSNINSQSGGKLTR